MSVRDGFGRRIAARLRARERVGGYPAGSKDASALHAPPAAACVDDGSLREQIMAAVVVGYSIWLDTGKHIGLTRYVTDAVYDSLMRGRAARRDGYLPTKGLVSGRGPAPTLPPPPKPRTKHFGGHISGDDVVLPPVAPAGPAPGATTGAGTPALGGGGTAPAAPHCRTCRCPDTERGYPVSGWGQ